MIRPELRELMNIKKQNLKIVLRVPALVPQISQAEREQKNRLYDVIEKSFYKAGFIVRDRALLERVLQQGINSYLDVAQKVDTDLILEIVELQTDVDLSNRAYFDPMTGRSGSLVEKFRDGTAGPRFPLLGGRLECRIITIKDGAVTGIFTIYCAPSSPEFEVLTPYLPPRYPEPNPNNYQGYRYGDTEATTECLSFMLIQSLTGSKMVIQSVESGSLAESYGFNVGDVILKIRGQEIFNQTQAEELIRNSWGSLDFVIMRGGQRMSVSIPDFQGQMIGIRYQFK
jgi:hypothetical protein